ncbi:MAG: excinuclease ABC subunit UvrA [Bdellovibrionales bacterium]|nr:excinuclease ABC subunit UvrA [Bdellovibrionales bacterium]
MTPQAPSRLESTLVVRGAREHNLKNVSLDIPKRKLVVITGLSGSGKSSLAFDTIYAEGQRRYVESLSAYARQFLEQMNKPDVDSLEGLAPAISIEQRTTNQSPRSTVGTITEIYDYVRLLWAKIARPVSPATGRELSSLSSEQIVDTIMALEKESRVQILAPMVVARKGEHKKELERLRKAGLTKARIDKDLVDLDDDIRLDKNKKHSVSGVIDRIILRDDSRARVSRAVESCIRVTKGSVVVESAPPEGLLRVLNLSTGLSCPESGVSFPPPEPRLFSFNSPVGACPSCGGLGTTSEFDPSLIAPDESLSIAQGALDAWADRPVPGKPSHEFQTLEALAKRYSFSLEEPLHRLPDRARRILFHGTDKEEIEFSYKGSHSKYRTRRPFEGILADFKRRFDSSSPDEQEGFEKFISRRPCQECGGARLRPEALAYKILGRSIAEVSGEEIGGCLRFFENISLSPREEGVAGAVLREITTRLGFLLEVGLTYLSLDRPAATLSGGEMQRVRLATQIGSSLRGVLYVLDEPSIGLHQRDNNRLLDSLKGLRDRGNSVLVVEHDRDTIEAADWVIDMGPGAGRLGGDVVAQGSPDEIRRSSGSVTGQYLTGHDSIPLPVSRRNPDPKRQILLEGCSLNNLRGVRAVFPLGTLICVSGVSGSGKSTLVFDTLIPAIQSRLYRRSKPATGFSRISGIDLLDKVIHVDQSAIGRTPRSNPATYSGLFTPIRALFAQTTDAQIRGYGQGRFSFNVKGGRCETCEGDGAIKVEMHFLPDVFVPCHACNGLRYNRETLSVRYRGKNIADVLRMTVDDALAFFEHVPSIEKILRVLHEVGLGYVTLGQSATTLSGGEAQRMKLSRELSKRSTGRTLYVLDEPSTGLHFHDIHQLIKVLHALVDQGNTVVVIEHNLDILKHADWLIDMGPEGGSGGGRVVGQGNPLDLLGKSQGHTMRYLAPYLTGR